MFRNILKSVGLIIGYLGLTFLAGVVMYFIDVDIYNIDTLVKIGYLEKIGWILVIGICIHWNIQGFKKLIGKG